MIKRSPAVANALDAFLVFAAAFVIHIDNLDNALLGWDTYATIIASRIESLADLWGTFSEVMMDGRLPFADFYRPVGNLFIALDHAVWGLEPFGYQLTNLALWSLSASLVFLLARRLLSNGMIVGPVVAVVFYILHPAVLSILSIAARRTEMLQIVFILLALVSLPVSDGERRTRRYVLAGLFAALAVGSKETGIIVLPLAFIHQFFTIERTAILDRAIAAFHAVVPAGVFVAGFLGARLAVIGGMGGYHEPASISLIERLVSFSPSYLQTVTVTGAPGRSSIAGFIFPAVFLLLVSVVVWLLLASRKWTYDKRSRVVGLGAVGVFWLLFQVGLACMSFQFSARYVVGMVAGLSLVLAALVEGIRVARTMVGVTTRPVLALAAASVAVAMIPGLAGSTLWYDYPGLAEASRIQQSELQTLADEFRRRPPLQPTAIRVRRQVAIMDSAVDHAWMLSPWGLQAWLEMSFPDTPIRVDLNNNATQSQSHWNLVLIPNQN
jgi:hypothetical protein